MKNPSIFKLIRIRKNKNGYYNYFYKQNNKDKDNLITIEVKNIKKPIKDNLNKNFTFVATENYNKENWDA